MRKITNLLPILIILILSYWAVAPLFAQGFFPIHDNTQVERVFEMNKALSDGMFPVRWVADLGYGYGYPIFSFYAPFAYYVGGFFMFGGLNALIATKVMMGFGMVLAGIFMYLLGREVWGEVGGAVAGLFYLYAPYHALDLYVRGDVAELWAYAFVPLAFLGVYKIAHFVADIRVLKSEKPKNKTQKSKISVRQAQNAEFIGAQLESRENIWLWVTVAAVGFAGVILSHNLTAMMVTPFLLFFCVIFWLFSKRKKQLFVWLFFALFAGLLLSAFYWLPVFGEMKYTNVLSQVGGGADYPDHFVCLSQLWNSPWGFGGSVKGCIDGLSFKIGKLHTIFSVLAFLGLFATVVRKKNDQRTVLIILSAVSLLFTVLFMLPLSKSVWDMLPPMAFLQYPWRFLLLASFFSSFLAGGVIWYIQNLFPFFKNRHFIAAILGIMIVLALIYTNAEVFLPQKVLSVTADYFTNTASIKWSTSKISDEYMPKDFQKPHDVKDVVQEKIVIPTGQGKINKINMRTQQLNALLTMRKASAVMIRTAYFPAWQVFVDGKEAVIRATDRGIEVFIPRGEHMVDLRFIQTPIEKVANIVSFAGIAVLIIGIIATRKRFS